MTRLPLQVGRAALAQTTRYAATLWLGPVLLLVGTAMHDVFSVVIVPASIVFMTVAFMAAEAAKSDRPSDALLDADGLTVQGGELDGKRFTWAETAGCQVVAGKPRTAVRWKLLSWLCFGQVAWLAERSRVPVSELQLPRADGKAIVLAEGEGDERESLESLRDAILGAAAPASDAAVSLPQEILKCGGCGAAQVPIAQPTMTCPFCAQAIAVPAELQERLRARAVLDRTSAPQAKLVAQLIAQPGASRAARVVLWARRVMVWIQPFLLVMLIAQLFRSLGEPVAGRVLFREQPDEDGVFFYELELLLLVVATTLLVAWVVGSAYLSNRRALRVLTEGFGAVPPVKAGAPSTCRQCNAPLPGGDALLVHCVYCAAENVIGVDPRPAAFRRTRETMDLAEALRHRRRARLRVWLAAPLGVLIMLGMGREVGKAWWIPPASYQPFGNSYCPGPCGTITNGDRLSRTVVVTDDDNGRQRATVLPHGQLSFYCSNECTLEVGADKLPGRDPDAARGTAIYLRIDHGTLHRVAPPPLVAPDPP